MVTVARDEKESLCPLILGSSVFEGARNNGPGPGNSRSVSAVAFWHVGHLGDCASTTELLCKPAGF